MASRSRRISQLNSNSSPREGLGFQAADGTRDYCTTPNRCASYHIFLGRSTHRAEDSMGVWVSSRLDSLTSDPIPIDRRDLFSDCLEKDVRRSNNTDSDHGVISCPKLLCFARFLSSNVASKGLDSARHMLNRLSHRRLVHYP